ncbi:hypothetical protein BDV96DRAFT_367314 [Lophiotrema nucula]|uniref:Uncharacterized protein n=1 Tax=Lophiotrema nucula TaxID=690887 RepID=A0A6A5ZIQ4_9PLEO|nr:hypothetical protein BDV96DRAFT_367314 [Lophiotrema nucula]
MEPARDAPWAEHEKVYLLAEILKAAPIPSHVLYGIIRDSNIQPKWNDIALPHGRTMRSCQMAYGDMTQTYLTPNYQPHRPPLPAPPMHYPGPDIPKKRPLQPDSSTSTGRLLQPRPPHSYPGEFMSGPAYAISPVGEPANKKKRGRPTKAEAQERAAAAAARGEVYPPPRKARTSMTGTDASPGDARSTGETPPAPALAPSMVAMTPQPQHAQPDLGSGSSSGKRKRAAKPTPLELEKPQREPESPLAFGSAGGQYGHGGSQAYSSFTPISAPLPSATETRDRQRDSDVRMEGVEESQPRTTTPHSFKDTVGI